MIQFNLLPDIKLEYIRTRRNRRLITVISVGVTSASLAVAIILFVGVSVIQKKHLSDLSRDINNDASSLRSTKDIDKILTVQSQLQSLDGLHNDKPVTTRLLPFIQQLTPAAANISQMDVDFDGNTIHLSGSADTLETVNKFVDTLKFTQYSIKSSDAGGTSSNAFSEVVLSAFGRDSKGASYTIDFKYDPQIFNVSNDVSLIVPNIISTRSELDKPGALFQQSAGEQTGK